MDPKYAPEIYFEWEPWYAWRPVKMLNGRWAWRRTICKRIIWTGFFGEYAEPFEVNLGMWP